MNLIKTTTLTAICLLLIAGCKQEKAIEPLRMHYILGQVFLNGQKASLGQTIADGDRIETGAESIAEISRQGQISVRVREESTIIITDSSGRPEINLLHGKVLSLLEKPGAYRVRTANAVAAIRGTIFFAAALDENTSYICCCNGHIAILHPDGAFLSDLQGSHHEARTVLTHNGRTSLKAATMLYHDDGEIFDSLYRLRYDKKP